MNARSDLKQAILTTLALLVPVAIFIAAAPTSTNSLKPPAKGDIPVAFVISEGAVIIDFCGPWEVFRDVMVSGGDHPFRLYTVSDKTDPITAGGGMKIVGIGLARFSKGRDGFVAFGPSHWLTNVGGAIGGLSYPIWGYWLAMLLMRSPQLLA